jgi:hypothetical protein
MKIDTSDGHPRIVIEQNEDGKVGVAVFNLPADKIVLYGLLRVAEEMIPKVVEKAGGIIQLPNSVRG